MMKRASLLVTDFMLFVILVIADQLTKHLAVTYSMVWTLVFMWLTPQVAYLMI